MNTEKPIFWGRWVLFSTVITLVISAISYSLYPSSRIPPLCIDLLLPERLPLCDPKTAEKFQYFSMTLLLILFGLLQHVLIHKKWVLPRRTDNLLSPIASIGMGLAVITLLVYQNLYVHAYWSQWHLLRAALASTLILLFISHLIPLLRHKTLETLAPWVFLLVSVWGFSAVLFPENRLGAASNALKDNYPFTFAEYAAVLNGSTPRVDFFPQYQNLLSYLMIPYFKTVGLSLTTFTTGMAIMSWTSVLAVYLTFWTVMKRKIFACLSTLAFLFISFHPVQNWHDQIFGLFTYFGQAPARYWGVLVLGCALARVIQSEFQWPYLLLGFLGALVPLNNLDFGLAAFLGAALTVCIYRYRQFGWFLLGFSACLISYEGFSFLRSGNWIPWKLTLGFQSAFGLCGFYSLPLPKLGLHWMIYTTFIASALTGLRYLFSKQTSTLHAVLFYYGISGLGAMVYYWTGRTHWETLQGLWGLWSVNSTFLLYTLRDEIKKGLRASAPAWLLLFIFVISWLSMSSYPNLFKQIQRLSLPAHAAQPSIDDYVAITATHVHPGQQAMIIHPYGHVIAYRAKIRNYFPFAQQDSLIVQAQVSETFRAIENNGVVKILGNIPDSMRARLEQMGFSLSSQPFADYAIYSQNKHSP